MKTPRTSAFVAPIEEPIDPLSGPAETIAASIPKGLADAVRRHVAKGEFSRFVTRAMHHELVRRNRVALVEALERELGPSDPAVLAEIDAAIMS